MSDENGLIELTRFIRLHQAELAASTLHGEGIDAFVPDGGIVGANPLLVGAVGYVRLLVPRDAADRARELLASAGLLDDREVALETDLDAEALSAGEADQSVRDFLSKDEG